LNVKLKEKRLIERWEQQVKKMSYRRREEHGRELRGRGFGKTDR
jgi:hypothetical protein